MDKLFINRGADQNNRQIRRSAACLRDSFLFGIGCILLIILSQDDCWIFVGAALLAQLYGFLTFKNDRVVYDETGITLYSIWGKPFVIRWNDVLDICVIEEPLISKQLFIGRVLHIKCVDGKRQSAKSYRFPYQYYIGIDDFLSFVTSRFAN